MIGIAVISRDRYPDDQQEGWGIVRPGDRKAHYYRDMDSLCQRVFFYNGPLEPDENHSPDDCKGCRKVLDKEYLHGPWPTEEDPADIDRMPDGL